MGDILKGIDSPSDLKKLHRDELKKLANEIRYFLIRNVSKTGGHLASNLGVVELTIALHYVFNTPKDKIVWDVGHQAYVHKILTGRKDRFNTLRQYKGLCGFPKPSESVYDAFAVGHSSTSVSAALGMAKARDLNHTDENIIAVIGDGSISGGIALEAINNAGRSATNMLVILNDNEMSISKNVGALSKHFSKLRTDPSYLSVKAGVHRFFDNIPVLGKPVEKLVERFKDTIKYFIIPSAFFDEMGFKYIGISDGHNIDELIDVLEKIKNVSGPVLLHVHTKKGKGYKFAEDRPWEFHGVSPFNVKTGKPLKKSEKISYSDVFGNKLVEIAKSNKDIVAITAAMADGTGLTEFSRSYPKRFFDVAISEQHAVTFAAGLAISGKVPVFAVYSTFLQRAYDQIIHDVCLQKLHVVFAVDRAGLVGSDGETHQGVFDISYLSGIPNMTIMSPKNGCELENMIEFAINFNGPIAVRYPRGEALEIFSDVDTPIEYGKSEKIFDGEEIAMIFEGNMAKTAFDVVSMLRNDGYNPILINARFIKPFDKEMLFDISSKCKYIFTIEDGLKHGGMGSTVMEILSGNKNSPLVYSFGYDDCFIEHGSILELQKAYGLEKDYIYEKIKSIVEE